MASPPRRSYTLIHPARSERKSETAMTLPNPPASWVERHEMASPVSLTVAKTVAR